MVYRMLQTSYNGDKIDAEDKKKNYEASINLAKTAVGLDMKDPQNWYVLGNAHLTNFFVNEDINVGELTSALKAYAQSEKNMSELSVNPDVYYNRATIYEYLERYNEAVADYNTAFKIDPNLDADKKANNVIGFVHRAYNAIVNKGKLKSNRLTSMVKSIPQ